MSWRIHRTFQITKLIRDCFWSLLWFFQSWIWKYCIRAVFRLLRKADWASYFIRIYSSSPFIEEIQSFFAHKSLQRSNLARILLNVLQKAKWCGDCYREPVLCKSKNIFQIIILHQIFADILQLVIEVITPCKTVFHKIGLNMFGDVSRSAV